MRGPNGSPGCGSGGGGIGSYRATYSTPQPSDSLYYSDLLELADVAKLIAETQDKINLFAMRSTSGELLQRRMNSVIEGYIVDWGLYEEMNEKTPDFDLKEAMVQAGFKTVNEIREDLTVDRMVDGDADNKIVQYQEGKFQEVDLD